jgi:UDP-N-acetylmuramoylalanine--D-glutamate ligase
MGEYLRLKSRIYLNQTRDDTSIVNEDDPALALKSLPGRRFGISKRVRPPFGAYVLRTGKDDAIRVVEGKKIIAEESWGNFALTGAHNEENLMAAIGLCYSIGIDPQEALRAAKDFKAGDHRLEFVGRFKGVNYYDDSKGTNSGAVVAALSGFPQKSVILILGGRDKDMDFSPLIEPVRQKVKKLILIGESKDRIKNRLKGTAPMAKAQTMEKAVEESIRSAAPGDTVLLSPACASFDMFKNYKERGEVFQAEVIRQNSPPQAPDPEETGVPSRGAPAPAKNPRAPARGAYK